MLKKLFSSEIRIKLLSKFLLHPQEEFYLRQLAREFGASPRSVSLELKNLESIKLIKNRVSGNQHNYSVNSEHPLYKELQNIFVKTFGIKDILAGQLKSLEKDIDFVFIYGSFANGSFTAQSDLDLLLIGRVPSVKISGLLLKAGNQIGREINYSIIERDEFFRRLKDKDHFLLNVYQKKKIFVIGESHEFERLAK